MRFLNLVLTALLSLCSCQQQTRANMAAPQPGRAFHRLPQAHFFGADDFYQIRLSGTGRELLRVAYLQLRHMRRWRRVPCNQESRTCQAFLRRDLTIFAIPLLDEHLWLGAGQDVCPQMNIRRNGRELRTAALRIEPMSCAYTFEQPPDERIHLGQRLVIIQ